MSPFGCNTGTGAIDLGHMCDGLASACERSAEPKLEQPALRSHGVADRGMRTAPTFAPLRGVANSGGTKHCHVSPQRNNVSGSSTGSGSPFIVVPGDLPVFCALADPLLARSAEVSRCWWQGINSPARGPRTGAERQPNSGVCGRRPYASGHSGSCSAVSERRQEAIAAAWHGGDEARLAPVVLEPRPQVANLAVHDVAFGDVVHTPQRVEDLFAGDHAPSVGCQQVQQALLQAGQVQL